MFDKILKEQKKEEKREEIKHEGEKLQEKPKMRQIIIETDGNNINIAKADVAGNLELVAVLGTILNKLNQPAK